MDTRAEQLANLRELNDALREAIGGTDEPAALSRLYALHKDIQECMERCQDLVLAESRMEI
jgi:hypothetical protein